MYLPPNTSYMGGGLRTLTEHERMTATADADILREAADALRTAYDALSETDPRLKQWADALSEEACELDDMRTVSL